MVTLSTAVLTAFVCLLSVCVAFQHDFSKAVLANSNFENLLSSLAQYQAQHSLLNFSAITEDPSFCQRRFSVAKYSCPHMIGNRMHEFLNAYIAAFVTNRTVLWEYCTRKPCQLDNQDDCDQVLERFPWIGSTLLAQQLWSHNNCEGSFNTVEVFQPRFNYMADEVAMCCGYDEIDLPIISYGTHDGHDFFGFSVPNARLSTQSKERARLLFQFGEHFAYGALFRTVFRYKESILEGNTMALIAAGLPSPHTGASSDEDHSVSSAGAARPLVIAMHLRHSGGVEEGVDPSGVKCIHQLLAEQSSAKRQCYLLLISDRNESITAFQNNPDQPCKVVTSSHEISHPQWTEHGPFTYTAVHDIEFVSRADVFIGSGYSHTHLRNLASTFSLLIAERIASSGGPYGITVAPRFLQGCVPVVGGRFNPKTMYLEESHCPKVEAKDMPDHCKT